MSGVVEVRGAIAEAQERLNLHGTRSVLFLDEIHRFNKAQQDALLPHVEDGTVTLIGATTENPYFEVNAALLSRMRVWRLEALTDDEVGAVVRRALSDEERGLAGSLGPSRRRRTDRRCLRPPRLAGRRRRPRRAQRPRRRGRDRRIGGCARRRRTRQPAARGCRGRSTAARPRLRPRRRRPLRHGLGVHQEPARQRPGRRAVLARGDDRGRRGPQVHRPPAHHQRLGGRRERRSARAVGGGRGRPGARLDRAAGGAVRARPGDDLYRDGPEVEPLRRRLLGSRLRRRGQRRAARAAPPAQRRRTAG